ncbi:3-keto-5-aminohexanoate cleavage protein [Polynucleobacter sp.]|jgi:3-keto-5-aminohexanoate cleavage enzyme|uniref:3-keto-5-aminohexanoate cleavage protein n=1 Tax=Polynucleobacter sp. TaxID=2029855 RepID=UPI002733C91A|nr:3-keto-5-aminohexanoate cleavage protein [Polynucleobacter sp.]MDP3122202.1 3-keto-5-aminohexanoate cleavage protein [Polynucleobacter sp.]
MNKPVIITVAITGAIPRKKDCPGLPVTVSEQIEETHKAYEAGAALVHLHVRKPDESPSSDPDQFAKVQEGIKKHCPDMIIQFSTGGRGQDQALRGAMLFHRPDMASLATGSVNFPHGIYENPPTFVDGLANEMNKYDIKPEIEVFDMAMLYSAADLIKRGLLKAPAHVQFVMGVPNAMPAKRSILEFLVSELKEIMPDATWTAAGIARHQLTVNEWALEMGGHARTGLEDNIKYDQTRVAKDNAELVSRVAELAAKYNRPVANGKLAREILGLRAAG